MSNLDVHPAPSVCETAARENFTVELLPDREVPLGGVRAMSVRRTLPQRSLPTVGAWCFLDSFGPDRIAMRVLPHPHIGLQTVTWPLVGEVHHRDSVGSDVVVRPGELNIMTAGAGISHSEFSPEGGTLSGLQLWVALPASAASAPPSFERHTDLPVISGPGFRGVVLVGSLAGVSSPATVYSPLVGAELTSHDGGGIELPLQETFEHAILVLEGTLTVDGESVGPGPLAYLGTGRSVLRADASSGARWVLLGGEPFTEELLMWWNFVGRSHEEIAQAREDWENGHPRFGTVHGHGRERIPAPALPGVRLTPRRRRPPAPGHT
ncbi:pirin family protein [Arthrobacter sp.]|uniref:pirin family protein n=1 Tax=Arthrobacter sp. TaxID=1667 RepID=UPI0028127743|nr:pirin family protein [Arthrobacter sp.]